MFDNLRADFVAHSQTALTSETVLRRTLIGSSLLSALFMAVSFVAILFSDNRRWELLGFVFLLVVGLTWLTLNTKLAYSVRAYGVVNMMLLASFMIPATSASDAIPILLIAFVPLMALVLLGFWVGLFYVVLSLGVLIGVAVLQAQGIFPLSGINVNNPPWVVDVINYFIMAGLYITMLWRLLFETDELLAKEIEAVEAMQQEQDNVEKLVTVRLKALQAANEMGQQLTRILDEDALLKTAVSLVRQTWSLHFVGLYQPARTQFKLIYSAGSDELLSAETPLLIAKARDVGLLQFSPEVGKPLKDGVPQLAAVPLWIDKQVRAVLLLAKPLGDSFSDQDIYVLQTISNQIAVAWENTIIYTRAEKQAQYETALGLIGDKIAATETIEEAIETAAWQLSQQLGVANANIEIGTPTPT